MDKPRKKIRVVGERRAQLDVARFADALIALTLHRLGADAAAIDQTDTRNAEQEQAA